MFTAIYHQYIHNRVAVKAFLDANSNDSNSED
jgi:hypothetical protein